MKWTYAIQEDGMTVEELLRNEWGLGKKVVHEMRMAKSVTNAKHQEVVWKEPLKKGSVLHFALPPASSPYEPKHDVELPILFEDDQGTSGLLMVAKHPVAKNVMDRMLEQKQLVRDYEAVVKGKVVNRTGTIDFPLGRDRHHPTRRRVSPSGQSAVTHYRVLKPLEGKTLLHLTLETGRTHQIRAHLSHINHPIIGDELYDGPPTQDGAYHLHAFRMSFTHPFTGEKIVVEDSTR